jgi:hypothetical protein
MRKERFLTMIKFIILETTRIQRLMENLVWQTIKILSEKILLINKAVAAMRKREKKRKNIFTIMDSMMKKEITKL